MRLQSRPEGGGGEAESTLLKLGAEPKATKVALDPESLSPAEDTRTVVLFKRNHFSPPGTESARVENEIFLVFFSLPLYNRPEKKP